MVVKATDAEFIRAWDIHKSPVKIAKQFDMDVSNVYKRRTRLETKMGLVLKIGKMTSGGRGGPHTAKRDRREVNAESRFNSIEPEISLSIINGSIVIFSDAHYWPGLITKAHSALIAVIAKLKPVVVLANGDLLDGATISRHPRSGWEHRPTVAQEVEAVCSRMKEIEKVAGSAQLVRTIGNHDARFENYISANAPLLEGIHGTNLFDFLPRWRACWTVHVNPKTNGWTVIRHVHVAGGIHSAYGSTVRAGTHYVHGHLHKLQVTPFGDYRGRRYGVDSGTLADPDGPQFSYCQGAPLNWCSGFAVLTFVDGNLLPPELCEVIDGTPWFRGEKVKI